MGQKDEPSLRTLPVDVLDRMLPNIDARRQILSRDVLASVDGFHVIVALVLEHLFGVNFCSKCPNCTCADLFGSNAKCEGGVLGRVDGVYGSIEAQKSAGSLRVHFQIFVQCLHQHTPLQEILEKYDHNLQELLAEYKDYKEHVCRQIYEAPHLWNERQDETEAAWPNYEAYWDLIRVPTQLMPQNIRSSVYEGFKSAKAYLADGKTWLADFFLPQVQRCQEMRQNHVHVWNRDRSAKVPLTHCRSVDDPSKCKSLYPRTQWLVEKTVLLCPHFLRERLMPCTGKKIWLVVCMDP